MSVKPVIFEWDGEAMVPQSRFRGLCDRQYVVHEQYTLVPDDKRSRATHNHYFAALHDAWLNLPTGNNGCADDFPTDEHLRKKALIRCGYASERHIVVDAHFDAVRVAAFLKQPLEYDIVEVNGNVVHHFVAESQSRRAMGAKRFQQSKSDVLDYVASLIGSTREELIQNAKRVA
jgi:hypothetical protein